MEQKITIELDGNIIDALAKAVLDRRFLLAQPASEERDAESDALLTFSIMMRDKLMQRQRDGLN